MIRRTFLAQTAATTAALTLGRLTTARAARPSALDRIEKDKVVRVGWAVWHPYVYRDPKNNQVVGVSLELLQDMAKALNARLEWVEDSWGTLPARWNAAMASANSTSATSASPSVVCKRAASRARNPSKNWTRCSRTNATPSSHAANARRTSALENAIPAIHSAYETQ